MEGFEGGSISAGNGTGAKTTTQGTMPVVASGVASFEAAAQARTETGVEAPGIRSEAAGVENDTTSGQVPADRILERVQADGLHSTMEAIAAGNFAQATTSSEARPSPVSEQPGQGTEPRLSAIRGDNPDAVASQFRNDLIRSGVATEVSSTQRSPDSVTAQNPANTQGGEQPFSVIRGADADAAADRLAQNLEQAGVATRVDTSAAETADTNGDQRRQETQSAQEPEGHAQEQDKQARQQELSEKIKAGTATPEEMKEYRDTKLNTEQRKQELTQKALDASITDDEIEELYKINQGMEAEQRKSGKEAGMSADMQEALKALNKLTQNPEFVNAFSGLLKLAGQEGNSILSALQKELQEAGAAAGEMNKENLDDQDEQELRKHPILYFLYLLMKTAVKTTAKVAQVAAPMSEKATKN